MKKMSQELFYDQKRYYYSTYKVTLCIRQKVTLCIRQKVTLCIRQKSYSLYYTRSLLWARKELFSSSFASSLIKENPLSFFVLFFILGNFNFFTYD